MAPKGAKAKKKEPDHDELDHEALLATIEETGDLPNDVKLHLLRCDQPLCPPGCKGGRKDNPKCFCGMIPEEGHFKRVGLFSKTPAVLGSLGVDPATQRRADPQRPAGLRNLGNTCYVNASLQMLASVGGFVGALLRLEPELAAADVVAQMRDLFLALAYGPRAYVDPAPFAASLQLDHAVQQDGSEFFKLLLQKLEGVFSSSARADVRAAIPRLLRGRQAYVTTCQACGRESAASAAKADFYELTAQVVGFKRLADSVAASLAPEELTGANQYHCEYCGGKRDATRCLRLAALPPYLCISLQRFVFDLKTLDKKKASDKLACPLTLDVGEVLAMAGAGGVGALEAPAPGPDGLKYELVAVLIHKGGSASHGHYVAHVKVPATRTWWRFDDEAAEEMGPSPTTHPGDHGTTAQAQAAGGGGAGTSGGGAGSSDGGGGGCKGASAGKGAKRKAGGAKGGGGARARKKGAAAGDGGGGGDGADADADGSDYEPGARKPAAAAGRAGAARVAMAAAATAAVEAAASGGSEEDADMLEALQVSAAEAASAMEEAANYAAAVAASLDPQQQQRQQQQQEEVKQEDVKQEVKQEEEQQQQPAKRQRSAAAPKSRSRSRTPAAKAAAEKAAAAEAAGDGGGAEGAGNDATGAGAGGSAGGGDDAVVSGNAYMLMYRCIGWASAANGANGGAAASADAAADAAIAAGPPPPLAALPGEAQARVAALAAEFEAAVAGYAAKRAEAEEAVAERRRVVRRAIELARTSQLLEAAAGGTRAGAGASTSGCSRAANDDGRSAGAFGALVPTAWLDAWANDDAPPGPPDTAPLACPHGQLDPAVWQAVKLVPRAAWREMVGDAAGPRALGPSDLCALCVAADLRGRAEAEDAEGMRARAAELVRRLPPPEEVLEAGDAYFVSKPWLANFAKRAPGSKAALPAPTAAIACPHGRLLPDTTAKTKRAPVPRPLWLLLRQCWERFAAAAAAATAGGGGAGGGGGGGGGAKGGAAGLSPGEKAARAKARVIEAAQKAAKCGAGADAAAAPAPAAAAEAEGVAKPAAAAAADDDVIVVDASGSGGGAPQPPDEQQQQQQEEGGGGGNGAGNGGGGEACLEFKAFEAPECHECGAEMQAAVQGHQEERAALEGERQALAGLGLGVCDAVEPGRSYYLVPEPWLCEWRNYLKAGGRSSAAAAAAAAVTPTGGGAKAAAAPPLPPLADAMAAILCACPEHAAAPLLAVRPPALVNKRGRFQQDQPKNDALRVVKADDWRALAHYHGGGERAVRARLRLLTPAEAADAAAAANGGQDEWPLSQEQQQQQQQQDAGTPAAEADAGGRGRRNARGGTAADADWSPRGAAAPKASPRKSPGGERLPNPRGDAVGVLVTMPGLCEASLARAEREAREAALCYSDAEVMVEVVTAAELLGAFSAAGGERKSRRARKGRVPLRVASSDTIETLKLKIYEALQVHPRNQLLHTARGPLPAHGALSLAQAEVLPDEELRVVHAGEVPDDDLDGLFDGGGAGGAGGKRRRQRELGFSGTALGGGGGGAAANGGGNAAANGGAADADGADDVVEELELVKG